MEGGDRVLEGTLSMEGVDTDTREPQRVVLPIQVYEAAITAADLIVSYQWLARHDILINPRRHGVLLKGDQNLVWVSGEIRQRSTQESAQISRLLGEPSGKGFESPMQKTEQKTPKRALKLFKGTGSVGSVLKKLGYEVVSLDKDPRWNADLQVDILEWDFQSAYPPGFFDLVTASPPCCEFSLALTTRERQMEESDRIVQRTLHIIEYFHPNGWWLENPRHGLLRTRPYMTVIPHTEVDYCQFSKWGYQKPTRIWGSHR